MSSRQKSTPPPSAVRQRWIAWGWPQGEFASRAGLARAGVSAIEAVRLTPFVAAALAIGLLTLVAGGCGPSAGPVTVRCAVIGGMIDTGLWPEVAARFQQATGIGVQVVATGPKHEISGPFRRGEADLITMHASDEIINLVADGVGEQPQPWARNDLLLVGPAADPAGVLGMADAVAALARIIASGDTILVNRSLGAGEVLHDLLAAGSLELDPRRVVSLPVDHHRTLLERATAEGAYTLVGRIPYRNGKIADGGLVVMVEGDPRLRRPYLVVVRTAASDPRRHRAAARLAAFLRAPETQAWLAEFGRGQLDDRPLFFPVAVP